MSQLSDEESTGVQAGGRKGDDSRVEGEGKNEGESGIIFSRQPGRPALIHSFLWMPQSRLPQPGGELSSSKAHTRATSTKTVSERKKERGETKMKKNAVRVAWNRDEIWIIRLIELN